MKYIAYGSNMSVEQMKHRCPDAKLIGTGRIAGARLEFYTYATVESSQIMEACVPVAVWEISERDEQRLDRYEGFPSFYIKDECPVAMVSGEQVTGMIYLMKQKRGNAPTLVYYLGILDAYEDLGLGSQIKKVLEPALGRAMRRSVQCDAARQAK